MPSLRAADIDADLRHLRKGAGVNRPDLIVALGGHLRAVIGRLTDLEAPDARMRILAIFRTAAGAIADLEIRDMFLATMGVTDTRSLLTAREEALAKKYRCSAKTISRRAAQDGCPLVAEEMLRMSNSERQFVPGEVGGWVVDSMSSIAMLGRTRPKLVGSYHITSRADGLSQLVSRLSVPQPAGARLDVAPSVSAPAGGEIIAVERLTISTWQYRLRLNETLMRGDTADFSVAVTLPSISYMRPYNVLVPLRRHEHFKCVVDFGEDTEVEAAWVLNGLPPAAAEDDQWLGAVVDPRQQHVVEHDFFKVQAGCVYGLRWRDPAR